MNELDLFHERDTNIFMLDSFPSDIHNVLDNPIDKLVKSIKDSIKESERKYSDLNKKDIAESARYKKLNKPRHYDNDLQVGMFSLIEDMRYMEEELNALFEMKIIYAFKHLEINLKLLLSMAYPEEFNSKTYKWEAIVQFLNSKNIDLKSLKEYNGVNQLRIVNNALKHSGRIVEQSISHIKEFKGKELYYLNDLERFYSRVKMLPLKFIISVKNQILKDLYDFSNARIKNIANSFNLRMTKEQAIRLSNELIKTY